MVPVAALLLTATALAGAPDDAARLLSRFPAGQVPATAQVIDAIADLGTQGDATDQPLLRSLVRDESGIVAHAAAEALDTLVQQDLDAQRDAFAAALPDAAHLRSTAEALPGEGLGPAEREAVAYARAVLGAADNSGPVELDPVAPEDTDELLRQADRLERAAAPRRALALYAQAAASGDGEARRQLAAFGVDAELLLLGMSAVQGPAPAAVIAPHAVEPSVVTGSDRTVRIMVERARRGGPLLRMSALDTLETLVECPTELSEPARAAAQATLEAAEGLDLPGRVPPGHLRAPLPR